jgi:hypothetical protein
MYMALAITFSCLIAKSENFAYWLSLKAVADDGEGLFQGPVLELVYPLIPFLL